MREEYNKLIEQCKAQEELNALYYFFRMITCLQKHERLRRIYKEEE